MKRKNRNSGVNLTATGWSRELAINEKTVLHRLKRAGLKVKQNQTYTTLEVIKAVYGDIQGERLRQLQLENDVLEKESRELDEEWIKFEDVEKLLADLVVLPLRSVLESLPTSLDVRCNPTDPELARGQLFNWKEETKRLLRDKLPKEKK